MKEIILVVFMLFMTSTRLYSDVVFDDIVSRLKSPERRQNAGVFIELNDKYKGSDVSGQGYFSHKKVDGTIRDSDCFEHENPNQYLHIYLDEEPDVQPGLTIHYELVMPKADFLVEKAMNFRKNQKIYFSGMIKCIKGDTIFIYDITSLGLLEDAQKQDEKSNKGKEPGITFQSSYKYVGSEVSGEGYVRQVSFHRYLRNGKENMLYIDVDEKIALKHRYSVAQYRLQIHKDDFLGERAMKLKAGQKIYFSGMVKHIGGYQIDVGDITKLEILDDSK